MFEKLIGIDLGTVNVLVYVSGKGIVLQEPSVVAISERDSKIVAVGHEARDMLGRTPESIEVARPLRAGVVADYVVTEAVGVRPAWQFSDKVELSSELEYRRRDFGGDPGFFSEQVADRRENQTRIGLSAGYHYSRALGFGASLRWESRNADSDAREYDATTASISANLRF